MISVQELLPTFDYLRDNGSETLRVCSENYPRNILLENLNAPFNLAKLDSVNVLNIVANNNADDTINAFRVIEKDFPNKQWEHGYPQHYKMPLTDHGLEYGDGDNIVPAISNKDFNGFNQIIFNNSDHLAVVSDAQRPIIEELTGETPEQEIKLNIIKKMFMVRIFSPAVFVIITPDGKKLGKDFFNNQDINEIPGAYYAGSFATIPNPMDGEYQIKLQGTGDGECRLSISGIDEATSTNQDFFGQIVLGQEQDFKINYSSSSPELIDSLEPQDEIAPSLIINLPQEEHLYNHSDNLIINYEASDDFSGIGEVKLKIDDNIITTTTINLFDYQIGAHILSVTVSDKAGNFTEKKIEFKIIADIESTISDINKVYKNGWLKSSHWKNILIGELKVLNVALEILGREKGEIIKNIEKINSNSGLSEKVKEKLILALEKKLDKIEKNRQKAINLDLNIFEKTLEKIKKPNYLNQAGYDIIKSDLDYLKNNL